MNIKDYLHLYLGCEMRYNTHHEPQNEPYILTAKNLDEAIEFEERPILRPLSDMDKTEEMILGLSGSKWGPYTAVDIIILLKEGFDLFGLIKYGMAINKTMIKP